MAKNWKTLRVVVELPVYDDLLTTAQLRWAVQAILDRHPPAEEFVTSDHLLTGRARVKSLARVQAAQRDDVFWGNQYGKTEGWALRMRDGKWFFVTTDRRKLATDGEAEAHVRARANEYHPAYYHDAVQLVDGDG